MILIVNANSLNNEEELLKTIKNNSKYFEMKAKNVTRNSYDYTFEFMSEKSDELVRLLSAKSYIDSVSVLTHNGDIHF